MSILVMFHSEQESMDILMLSELIIHSSLTHYAVHKYLEIVRHLKEVIYLVGLTPKLTSHLLI